MGKNQTSKKVFNKEEYIASLENMSDEKLIELTQKEGIVIEKIADASRETVVETIASFMEAKEKGDEGKTTPKPSDATKSKAKGGSSKVYFYWLKMKSYADANKVLGVGLYRSETKYDRLVNSPAQCVETFEDEIDERTIIEIAKMFKLKTETFINKKRIVKTTEELLEELVQNI